MIVKLLISLQKERNTFDARCVALLRASLGAHRTREIVEELVFHLTDRMGLLERALAAGSAPESRALAQRMAAMSAQAGLTGFARVARDLGACVECGDEVAAAAVAARLRRLADRSMLMLLDHADRSAL